MSRYSLRAWFCAAAFIGGVAAITVGGLNVAHAAAIDPSDPAFKMCKSDVPCTVKLNKCVSKVVAKLEKEPDAEGMNYGMALYYHCAEKIGLQYPYAQ